MSTLNVFVYGTLRPGYRNRKMPVDAIIHNCTTEGALFSTQYGYPGADFNESGVIHGDVLVFDLCDPRQVEVWAYILDMELGASYAVHHVEVAVDEEDTINAVAFQYLDVRRRTERIESGDFIEWATEQLTR